MNERAKIIEAMARAMDTPSGQEYMPVMRQFAERALTALHPEGMAVVPGWQPIKSAPTDRLILVYCPSYQGLNAIVCCCQWHEDAGFCVDELRSPSHWMPLPAPPTNSPQGGKR